jgi:hypothetical protein
MNWLLANKEWIFSGIGVALLGLLYAVFSDRALLERPARYPQIDKAL